jgi:hypothetical protein
MKNFTKTALVALSAIMLVPTISVLTPRAVHALAGAQDLATAYPRSPWAAQCTFDGGSFKGSLIPIYGENASCTIYGPAALPGGPQVEVVIQTVTFQGSSDPSHEHVVLQLQTTTGGQPAVWSNQILKTVLEGPPTPTNFTPPFIGGPHSYYLWSQPLTFYCDPSPGTIVASINTDGANTAGLIGTVSLVGYTVASGGVAPN